MLHQGEELKDRAEAYKHQLLSRYNELKADTRAEAREMRDRVKAELDELEEMLRAGWNNMTEAAKNKLNTWLDRH